MSITLWPEQEPALEHALSTRNTALFCEQRTGKTFLTLKILELHGKDLCGVLVTLLNNKETTWLSNLEKYLPQVNVTTDLEEFRKLPNPRLLVIHWEQLPKIITRLVRYKKLNWACADESHRAQHRGTKFARALARLHWVERKILLTGTPFERDVRSLFQQFKFLDQSVFGTNWNDFCENWFEWPKLDMTEYPYGTDKWKSRLLEQKILKNKMTLKEDSSELIASLIRPYVYRLTKKDVGIKEPKVSVKVVGMSANEQAAYKQMAKKGFLVLKGGERLIAHLKVTQISKLRQLASGWVFDEEKNIREYGKSKLKAVKKWLKKRQPPVVIFTAFIPEVHELKSMSEKLGFRTQTLYGKTPKRKRPNIIRGFLGGYIDVLICQGRTGGTGVDLYSAQHAAVVSLDYSYIVWDQLKSRLDHRDKEKASKIKVFCSHNTIDVDLYDLVIKKGLTGKEVFNQLKTEYKPMVKVKGDKSAKTEKSEKKSEGPKYKIADAIEYAGVDGATLRGAFRRKGIDKYSGEGFSGYGWDNQKDMKADVDAAKANAKKGGKKGKKKSADDDD